jgi:pyocin large subunit-like protein
MKKALLTLAALAVAVIVAIYQGKSGGPSVESGTQASGGSSATIDPARETSARESPAPTPQSKPAPGATPPLASAPAKPAPTKPSATEPQPSAPGKAASSVGFGSTRAFDEHYEKHGAEFGSVSQAEYLALAQKLRDAPAGGAILEAVRDDGVISRFDKKSGAFLAFNKNKTIRTFFKPNDGVRYFERQIDKDH